MSFKDMPYLWIARLTHKARIMSGDVRISYLNRINLYAKMNTRTYYALVHY